MKKVGRKELVILAVVLAAFSLFAIPQIMFHAGGSASSRDGGAYYCPMHPSYTADRPGDCPICNMKLVRRADAKGKGGRRILFYRNPMGAGDASPVAKKDAMGMDYIPVYEDEVRNAPSSVPDHAVAEIPVARQQLIGVKLGGVEKRAFTKEIRTVGRVAFDPELYSAQQEFLSALVSADKAHGGPYPEVAERSKALAEAARTRLELLGMSKDEMVELEKIAAQDRNLILPSAVGPPSPQLAGEEAAPPVPVRKVWVYATVYEYELPFVKVGSKVRVRVPTFPDKEFSGGVRALDPVLDAATRSIRVRASVEDPEGLLKPEMYVDVYLGSDLGELVAVPEEAVMYTGEHTIVFVAQGEGFFEPRDVTLGAKAQGFYEIREGLVAGERVAISGNFLIDSESRLQAALAGMAGQRLKGTEHKHG